MNANNFEPYDFTPDKSEDLKYYLLALFTFIFYMGGYFIIFPMIKFYMEEGKQGAGAFLMILIIYNTLFFLPFKKIYLLVTSIWKKRKPTILSAIFRITTILFITGGLLFFNAYLTVHIVTLLVTGKWNPK